MEGKERDVDCDEVESGVFDQGARHLVIKQEGMPSTMSVADAVTDGDCEHDSSPLY